MAEEKVSNNDINDLDREVDILGIISKLWIQRRRLIKWSICGAVIGIVIAFSIPKSYKTEVVLAPEIDENYSSTAGGLGALMAMAGGAMSEIGGADAVYPILYPDVVNSTPFMTDLFDMEVETKDGEKMTLQEYMLKKTRKTWWSKIIGFPFKLLTKLTTPAEKVAADHKLDPSQLTLKEYQLMMLLQSHIKTEVDTKTSVVTVVVTMQDPKVSAIVADKVVKNLQEYVIRYRTNKARTDLEYAKQLNLDARDEYYAAQQRYADYLDANHGLAHYGAQTVRERLENEAALAFELYNQTARQEQIAQAKVQEKTPVFAVLKPAMVPLKPTSPRKFLILVMFTFLGFAICASWILFGKETLNKYKKIIKESKESAEKAAAKK